MCPSHWLLIQTLRHSQFKNATSLQEALEIASSRQDQRIGWTNPDQPVVPLIVHGNKLDFNSPAKTSQINTSIQKIARTAGILDLVVLHNIGAGGARNLANLVSILKGVGTTTAGKALGHRESGESKSTTDSHIEPLNVEISNRKLKLIHKDWKKPDFAAESHTPQPLKGPEKDAYGNHRVQTEQ